VTAVGKTVHKPPVQGPGSADAMARNKYTATTAITNVMPATNREIISCQSMLSKPALRTFAIKNLLALGVVIYYPLVPGMIDTVPAKTQLATYFFQPVGCVPAPAISGRIAPGLVVFNTFSGNDR